MSIPETVPIRIGPPAPHGDSAGLDLTVLVPVMDEVATVEELAQLGVLLAARRAHDGQHKVDVGREQALSQHAASDHAGAAEQHDFHDALRRPSRRINGGSDSTAHAVSSTMKPHRRSMMATQASSDEPAKLSKL